MISYKKSLKILKETNALLEGHFVLSSGLHSAKYVQCAQLLSKPIKARLICESLAQKIRKKFGKIDLILSPAIGAIVIGYEMGRLLNVNSIFVERIKKKFVLRRGFKIKKRSKVLIDKKSPFLKSIIINKGFNFGIEKGMAVLDGFYMVGRITEVNYLSSRALLISDLNSKIPVMIEPSGAKAIMSGTGKNYAILDFLPKNQKLENDNIVYTSGSDGIFSAGIPIGKIKLFEKKYRVEFFSDLSQINFIKVKLKKEKNSNVFN